MEHSTRSSFLASLECAAYARVRVYNLRKGRAPVRLFHYRATATARICASFQPSRFCNNNFASAIPIRTSPPFTFSQTHRSAPRFLFRTLSTFLRRLDTLHPSKESAASRNDTRPSVRFGFRELTRSGLNGGRSRYFHSAEELVEAHRYTYDSVWRNSWSPSMDFGIAAGSLWEFFLWLQSLVNGERPAACAFCRLRLKLFIEKEGNNCDG